MFSLPFPFLFSPPGGNGLVESNGLKGRWVSVEFHSLGPQNLHWPECLSGPPRTACDAGRRSDSGKGSFCFAFYSFCGG